VIQHLKRVSRPGRRYYVPRDKVPRVRSGLGTAILTTPKGVMTDREAREAGIGGEVLAELW
jgi:small subunit ribosomal protein S8